MNRRLTLVIVAVVVAVVSFIIASVLASQSASVSAISATGDQVAENSSGVSLGGVLLGDTIVLLSALAITFVIGATRGVREVPNRLQGGLEVGVQFLKNVVFAAVTPTATRRTPWGLVALGGLALAIVFCVLVPFFVLPGAHLGIALPVISVPGEPIPGAPDWLTNTLVGTFLADLVAIGFAYLATSRMKEVPGRLQSIFELLVEFIDGMAKQMAGPVARQLFPLAATFFLFVLCANWIELIPGVDSIGMVKCAEVGQNGYPANDSGTVLDVHRPLDSGKPATEESLAACKTLAKGGTLTAAQQKNADVTAKLDADSNAVLTADEKALVSAPGYVPLRPNLHVVSSFVRAAATDLNLTLMLAIVAFITIQYYGFKGNGGAYLYKFFNVPALRTVANGKTPGKKIFGGIDVIVGLLEAISEIAKILSFGFRLFGNIFAGQALLFVMTFLVATLLPVIFYGLELFVGAIQAYVFAMLLLMFSGMAMAGHHGEEEEQHHGQDPAAEAGTVGNL